MAFISFCMCIFMLGVHGEPSCCVHIGSLHAGRVLQVCTYLYVCIIMCITRTVLCASISPHLDCEPVSSSLIPSWLLEQHAPT